MSNPNPFLRSPFDDLIEQQKQQATADVEAVQQPEVVDAPAPAAQPKLDAPSMAAGGMPAAKQVKTDNLVPPDALRPTFEASAKEYGVPVNVLMALAHQESRYDPMSVNKSSGAKGLMNYMDATSSALGFNPFDSAASIKSAAKQLRERLDKGYSMDDAVKEHFAGPDRAGWKEKTAAYGTEVLAKAKQIGALMYPAEEGDAPATAEKSGNQAKLDKMNGIKPNQFSPTMARSEYLANFQSMNPQAGTKAIEAVMAQYDAAQDARTKAGGNRVQDKFAQMASPEATFNAKLNAKLQAGNEGVVQVQPANAAPANPVTGTPAARPGIIDQAKGDFGRGMKNLQALGYGAAGLAAEASDKPDDATEFLNKYVAIQNETAKTNPATIGTYKNIKGFGDAGRYAIEAVAENLPMLLPSLVTGGVGALAGKEAAKRLVVGMVQSQVEKGVAREVAEQAAAKFVARTIMAGSAAGAAASSVPMESGSIMGDIYQDTSKKAVGTSLAYGIPAGLLDTLEPVMALRKIAGPVVNEVAGSIFKRLGVEAGKQFIVEAGTEGLQTILEEAAKTQANGKRLFTPELADAVIDSMLKGGIGGAGIGVMSQAVHEGRAALAPGQQPVPSGAPVATPAAPVPTVPAAGPLTAATHEAAAGAAPRVTAETPQGEVAGTVLDGQQDGDNFTAQILGDDGQVHEFNSADGGQIAPVAAPAGPLTAALGEGAAAHTANPAPVPEMPAAPPVPAGPVPLEGMSMDELKARITYVNSQATRNGGATKETMDERKRVEKQMKVVADHAVATSKQAEEPITMGPFEDIKAANKMLIRAAESTGQMHEVVEKDGKFTIKPYQEKSDVETSGNADAPGNGNGRMAGDQAAAPSKENKQVGGKADQGAGTKQPAVSGEPAPSAGTGVAVPSATADAKPALKQKEVPATDRPMAADGLTSYRYQGRYGPIMIGANDHADALKQAKTSFSDAAATADPTKLEVWDGEKYVPAGSPKQAEMKARKAAREKPVPATKEQANAEPARPAEPAAEPAAKPAKRAAASKPKQPVPASDVPAPVAEYERNPYTAYSFSDQARADAFMTKKSVDTARFEAKQTGPVRWQVVPREAPPAKDGKPAGKSAYELPDDVSKDWRGSAREDFKPTSRQQMLMDSAARAKDAGLFYTNEVQAFVEKDLGISPELRAMKKHGTEGGDVGYDIYHAARAVDEQRGNAEVRRVEKEMGLKVGDKLGTLIFNDYKNNTGVTVTAVNGTEISLTGKRGAYTVKMDASVTNIKYAMDRAHEKGKRKDSYADFVAARAAAITQEKSSAITAEKRQPQVIDEESYLAQNGASRQDFGDATLHMSSNNVSTIGKKRAIAAQSAKDTALAVRREELRAEYKAKVEAGELRAPTGAEVTERTAAGLPELESTQAAQRLIAKRAARAAEREAQAQPKPLDHGELNIPNRTKNIDAELDKYKATQAKAAKVESKSVAQQKQIDKARAKELFAEVGDAIVARHGEKLGAKELRKELDQMVKWEPKKFIRLAEKHIQEVGAAPVLNDLADERTIEVDGVRRPINNSNGKPVAQTFAGQVAFWRWFGNSKVVDAKGRPLVAYHGTGKDFGLFKKGVPISLTSDPSVASFYSATSSHFIEDRGQESARNVLAVYVKIERPKLVDSWTLENGRYHEKGLVKKAMADGFDSLAREGGNFQKFNEVVIFSREQIKSATGNNGMFDPADANITKDIGPLRKPAPAAPPQPAPAALAADSPLARMGEPKRVATLQKLRQVHRLRAEGKIDDATYRARIETLIGKIEDRNASKTPAPRERGVEWVTERLMRARRLGELDAPTVDFALWALEKAPSLANDLAISIRASGERGTAGSYQSAERLMTLFKGTTNEGTAVHEMLHHSERMMPAAIQQKISQAWFDAYMREFEKSTPAVKLLMEDMLAMGGDKKAADRTIKAFADGKLQYDTHYQLVNASEYWAVNATRIMSERFGAQSWQAKAKRWLSEMVQTIKGLLKLPSDAPVLKAIDAVLNGTGAQVSPKMLMEGSTFRDITDDAPPAEPSYTPPDQGIKAALRTVQAAIQDNMNRVNQVQANIAKASGAALPARADYYAAETNRPGRIAARLEDMRDGLIEPMMQRLAKSGHTPEQLEELLYAMHAKERNEAVARINPEHADTEASPGSGMADSKADEVIDKYKDATELHIIADQARAITAATLDLKLAYGRITPEKYETLKKAYDHYVPLKGDGEYGPNMKRAMGHAEREEFIVQNIARDYAQAVVTGEKNLARQSLAQMILQFPDPELWTARMPPKGRYIAGQVFYVKKADVTVASYTDEAEVSAFLEGKGSEAGQYTVEDSAGESVAQFTKPLQENEVMVYFKGQALRLQIKDEKLAAQLRPLNQGQMNAGLEFMRQVNGYLSKIYTGYNPAFILRNTARDAMTGTINMMGNQGSAIAAKAWTKYPAALATMLKWAHTKNVPAGRMGEYLNEYRQQGGKVGASYMSDLEDTGKSIQRMYDDVAGLVRTAKTGSVKRTAVVVWDKTVMKLAHAVEVANQGTENALRLSLFAALREAGHSPGKAAQAAKGVTVDFDRKGTATPSLGALYLFTNPAVQGTANAFRTLSSGKHKGQAWAALGALGTLGYFLAASGMDDDKDRWMGEPWDIRAKNVRYRVGNQIVNIPISQEFAPFFAFGTAMAEAGRGESKTKASARILSSFLDAYIPLKNLYNPESDAPAMDALIALTPTIATNLVQTATNRNSFGSKIVPEGDNTKGHPDNLKMNRGTKNSAYDSVAQVVAGMGVKSGFSREYENDITKISPETLKLWWRAYTGGLGAFIADTAGVTRMTGDDPAQIVPGDVPFVKDFVKPVTVKPLQGRYYEMTREARSAIDEFKQAKKAGNADAIQQLTSDPEKEKLIGLGRMVQQTTKAAGMLADQAVEINSQKDLSGSEKRAKLKELEKAQEELYRAGIGAFNNR